MTLINHSSFDQFLSYENDNPSLSDESIEEYGDEISSLDYFDDNSSIHDSNDDSDKDEYKESDEYKEHSDHEDNIKCN
jgi:hypothetical protein